MPGNAWASLGAPGDPYPAWVRALRAESGVYVIREKGLFGSTVVYVGESHSGTLKKTLTRHFQGWKRSKAFWEEFFNPSGSSTDPGRTYDRDKCEVRIWVCPAGKAVDLQFEKIAEYKPRDNLIKAPPDPIVLVNPDDDPFA